MRLNLFRACIIGTAVVAALTSALAQQRAYVTRSVPRDPTPHVMGHAALSPRSVTTWGGVLGQADSLTMQDGQVTNLTLTLALDEPAGEGLLVEVDGSSLFYPIAYAELVPMALFIESNGTGLYTDFSDDLLEDSFDTTAGTINYGRSDIPSFKHGQIALEFYETVFERALEELDYCGDCLEPAPMALLEQAKSVQYEWGDIPRWSVNDSYINTDYGSEIFMVSEGDFLELQGTIARYSWSVKFDANGVSTFGIDTANVLRRPSRNEFVAAFSKLDELQQGYDAAVERLETLADGELAFRLGEIASEADELAQWLFYENPAVVESLNALADEVRNAVETEKLISSEISELESALESKPLADGYFLIETLALLRTARKLNQDNFALFMATVRDPNVIEARPEPWERYTQSFCLVYPEEPGCSDG